MDKQKIPTGLTDGEAAAKTLAGKNNAYHIESGRSTWQIIRDNTFNLFIVINFIIAVALVAVGSPTNALFIGFVAVGVISGIVVELRARSLVNKLTLLNKADVTVMRGGKEAQLSPDIIVLGDILVLDSGDQVPADATVLQGFVEVNEALLTGEPDLIVKKRGSELLSGSYITSGHCYAEVKHVGADNYVTKLAIEAKVHKPINSEIIGSIRKLTKFTSRVIIPLGILLLLEALFILYAGNITHDTVRSATVSTAAALLGMLPKGLLVLTIIALITAVFKLGRRKVLVQEMYSVETMARIDIICLDKTGTLTDGKMRVRGMDILGKRSEKSVREILGAYLANAVDNNSTMEALKGYFDKNEKYKATNTIPFSSDRKWGAIHLEGIGMVVLGAPERIFGHIPEEVAKKQRKGRRVLGLGIANKRDITSKQDLSGVTPIAMIELEDGIRKGAEKTLDYLREQGIETCVISGDNPTTVSKIAERAGFADFDNYIDTSNLSDAELKKAVTGTAIFGRVSPHQKRLIIRELQSQGKVVAMTGDGVNDILALREADLSIVMAEGDSAAKQVGNIVLLESSFSELPEVLFEGRRVVNNMFRVSSIFFIKTIYAFFVAVLCALSPLTGSVIVFPLIAIQITVIDQILEGFPTFFMSFEADKSKVPKDFLKASLLRALPQATMITIAFVAIYFYATTWGWSNIEMVTLMYHALGTITLIGVFKAMIPFSKLRVFLFATCFIGFYLSAFIIASWPFFAHIVQIEVISSRALIFLAVITATSVVATLIISHIQKGAAWQKRLSMKS